jgi:hypothetical protein
MFNKHQINLNPESEFNNNSLSLKFHLLLFELKQIDMESKLSNSINYEHVKRLLNEMSGLIEYCEIKNKN